MLCHICNKPLSGRYYVDAWDRKACASHIDSNEIVQCSSCRGFTDTTNTLSDGRVLCPICTSLSIKAGDKIDPIIASVFRHLCKVGFSDLRMEDVTIRVVSAAFMAKTKGSQIDTNNKGLTLSKIGAQRGFFSSAKRTMQHTIYMLESQTKVEFAGTLAHELLHAWQVQNNISPPAKMCEGFCNLAAYYVLLQTPSSLAQVLIENMKKSPDPIYGDGFREVFDMYEEMEWDGVIDFYKHKYKKENRYGIF